MVMPHGVVPMAPLQELGQTSNSGSRPYFWHHDSNTKLTYLIASKSTANSEHHRLSQIVWQQVHDQHVIFSQLAVAPATIECCLHLTMYSVRHRFHSLQHLNAIWEVCCGLCFPASKYYVCRFCSAVWKNRHGFLQFQAGKVQIKLKTILVMHCGHALPSNQLVWNQQQITKSKRHRRQQECNYPKGKECWGKVKHWKQEK